MPRQVGYPVKLRRNAARKYKDAVAEARTKLKIGQQFRMETREHIWERSEKQYLGEHWELMGGAQDTTSDLIVVNLSFGTVNTIQPYMTGSEPRFLVEPYSGDATPQRAAVQQALLNRLWSSAEVNGQEHLEVAAGDSLMYGDGYLKVGYDIEKIRTAENEWKDVAKIWVMRVDPWDVWIDPSATGLHDARWVCQKLRVTKDELQSSAAYFNTDEENVTYGAGELRASGEDVQQAEQRLTQEVFDGSEYAVVYEFYDLVKMRMLVFSDGELPIRWVEDIGSCPIVQLANYRIPNSPYHMSELEQIWSLQAELNKTRSHMITHRRRQAAKVFAKKGALGTEAVQALQSPVVMDVAFVEGDQPLDQLVKTVDIPNLAADIYNVSQIMQNDIYEISGVNEYLRGAGPDIRRTATEASIIEGSTNIKTQFKLRQVEKAARKVGRLMLATARDVYPETDYDEIQLYLTGRDADKIVRAAQAETMASLVDEETTPEMLGDAYSALPPMAQDAMVTPSADIFVGEYEVHVEQASTEMRNPQVKEDKFRQMAIDLVQLAGPLMQLGITVNVKRVLEQWFESAGIDDVEAMFEAPSMAMDMMGALAPTAAPPQAPGMPAPGAAPPMAPITPENSGMLPAQ